MSIQWHFRPNTQDEDIYNEVYVKNCYRLPDDLSGKVIIDIGANVGAFTIACLDRNAARVIAVEPDRDNFKQLSYHADQHSLRDRVSLMRRAVVGDAWKSKSEVMLPEYEEHEGVKLTGGVSLLADDGLVPALTIPIQELLYGLSNVWLKLDCEGMEYQILSSILNWSRIDRIFGEIHEFSDFKFSRDTSSKFNISTSDFGDISPNPLSLLTRLNLKGFVIDDKTDLIQNEDDPHLYLFFVSREKIEKVSNVAILTPFRNARRYLSLYFKQISSLRDALREESMSLRLIAAEGDSTDGTRERIVELAEENNIPLEIVDTTHGHMSWGSVEDPVRMRVMSEVMNKALSVVKESDDIVVWIMSDLEWRVEDIISLIFDAGRGRECFDIFSPLALVTDNIFYDTWAYRKDNERFSNTLPYHSAYTNENLLSSKLISLDSAGTCLVMRGEVARSCHASDMEAVSFCADARDKGYSIALVTDRKVYHAPPISRRLLWIGDAICISGFSKVTHSVIPILAEAGYEIDIIATNYYGTPHNYPYRIWPASVNGKDHSGMYRMQMLLKVASDQDQQYDAIVVLDDPWNVPRITHALEDLRERYDVKNLPPVVAWVTVDGKNINSEPLLESTDIYHIACSTEFGVEEFIKQKLLGNLTDKYPLTADGIVSPAISVIPFGVDTNIFRPLDKLESRKLVSSKDVPEDAFIVGVVSTNQLRKRLDLVLKYFAAWIKREKIDNAYLYLCLGQSDSSGCDILSLIRYYGLRKRVILNTSLLNDQAMAYVYNSFDVYISLSQGEGFNLCALEAMACGVPCVLSDWAAHSSWVPDDCAVKVPCTSTALSSPLNEPAYVIGGVADQEGTVIALHWLYTSQTARDRISRKGIELSKQFPWKSAGEKLLSVVNLVIESDSVVSPVPTAPVVVEEIGEFCLRLKRTCPWPK